MSTLRPRDLTEALEISPATLRLWSNNFSPVLSPGAQKAQTEAGTPAQRRYTEDDLETLRTAKHLLSVGKTYEETLAVLQAGEPIELPPSAPSAPHTVATLDDHPMFVAFREALASKDAHIATLQQQIEELKQQPSPTPMRFRWRFLDRFLLEND